MDELKTILGTDIPLKTRGVFYICNYRRDPLSIGVLAEALFEDSFKALQAYANTRNPESQLAYGTTFDELIKELHKLHVNMKNDKWLKSLGEAL